MIVFAITMQMTIRSNHQRCSVRKGVLRNSQNSEENTCARFSFLTKLQAPSLKKKRLWRMCFSVNFAKFLRTNFSQNTSGRLLLDKQHFLVENPSRVLNGQQQHKGVIFHWSRISPSLVKLF